MRTLYGILASLLLLGLSGRVHAEAPAALRRFALLVGANDGGPDRTRLRYAATDAQGVDAVMLELGGVKATDRELILDPTASGLKRRILRMSEAMLRARRMGQRVELVFYYSGHSDEQGLRLANELVPYRTLRRWLTAAPADVRIAVLDSCASGALTRSKGGQRVLPFVFDTSTKVQGHAFLTSSSATEASQESDRIGGSFFTHYFVSGLRGAADATGDGKITLSEAYHFAFDETLARTGSTQSGAQHPAYEMQLVGTGDLVMTDLRSTRSALRLGGDVDGRIFVHDERGRLIAELQKLRGKEMTLGLPGGGYRLALDRAGQHFSARVQIASTQASLITLGDFSAQASEATAVRGSSPDVAYERVPVTAAVFDTGSGRARPRRTRLGFNLIYGTVEALDGVQLGLGGNGVLEWGRGVQFSAVFNYAQGSFIGAQLAAGSNVAEDLLGLQVGAVNVARSTRGLQLGLVNVSTERMRGLQLGLVNYANDADAAVGILSLSSWSHVHWQLWSSSVALMQTGVRFDQRYTYSLLSLGFHPHANGRHLMTGFGIGVKLGQLGPAHLELDVSDYNVYPDYKVPDDPHWISLLQARLLLRYEVMPHLSIIAGPALNLVVADAGADTLDVGLDLGGKTWAKPNSKVWMRLSPGFAAGISL